MWIGTAADGGLQAQLREDRDETQYAPQGNDGNSSGKIGFGWDVQQNIAV
jgi:hypothetical protein